MVDFGEKEPAEPLRPLAHLTMYAGQPDGRTLVDVRLSNTLLFIGPNNSGKTLALREIYAFIIGGQTSNFKGKILHSLAPDWSLARAFVDKLLASPAEYNLEFRSDSYILHCIHDQTFNSTFNDAIINEIFNKNNCGAFLHRFVRPLTRVDRGRTRFENLEYASNANILGQRYHLIAHLHHNPDKMQHISDLLRRAFGLYCTLDYTDPRRVYFRFSRESIPDVVRDRQASAEALKALTPLMRLDEVSDGVAAYLSLMVTLNAARHAVLLIDEPEVYLYPALAKRFGAYATRTAREGAMNLIMSTHSPDLLAGCVEASADINIVRLIYDYPTAKIFTIASEDLRNFIIRPLIRSTKALSALFSHGAIVTESDGDRMVYEAMVDRIREKPFESETIQVLNAHGKDSLSELIGPLRAFGVPAAAIADIDILNHETRTKWRELLRVSGVPDVLLKGSMEKRQSVWEAIVKAGEVNNLKKIGMGVLSKGLQEGIRDLIDEAKAYGIFVVPVGELEGWVRDLPEGSSSDWHLRTVEHLHGRSDVPPDAEWPAFVSDILTWIRDGSRKGMGRPAMRGYRTG